MNEVSDEHLVTLPIAVSSSFIRRCIGTVGRAGCLAAVSRQSAADGSIKNGCAEKHQVAVDVRGWRGDRVFGGDCRWNGFRRHAEGRVDRARSGERGGALEVQRGE